MILEGEMANKKHLIETKLGYYKNKLLRVSNVPRVITLNSLNY
jgi:hypothetical protein